MKDIMIDGKTIQEISKETGEPFYNLLSRQDYNEILSSLESFEEAEYIFDYAQMNSPLAHACVEKMRKSLGEMLYRHAEWVMTSHT